MFWSTPERKLSQRAEKARRRVARMKTPDLPGWGDQAFTELSMSYREWRRHEQSVNLEDAIVGAEALLAVLEELRSRGV